MSEEEGMESAKGRNRTDDTSIFSAVLYQLSYLGMGVIYHVSLFPSRPFWPISL